MVANKTAASENPKAYSVRYVEGLSDARTQLAAIFNILTRIIHEYDTTAQP